VKKKKKILEMLQQGKIGVEEAEKLLAAVAPEQRPETGTKDDRQVSARPNRAGPECDGKDRPSQHSVPMKLIRAGLKLAAFLPKDAQSHVNNALHEKGMDVNLSQIKPEDIEELMMNLDDLTVEVEGKQRIRIYSE